MPGFAAEAAQPTLRLALSGGGHRASLFGLGVLLYLVDAGINRRVEAISSVSGGSIVNAFVAQQCEFTRTTSEEFDRVAGDILAALTSRRLLIASALTKLATLLLAVSAVLAVWACLLGWPFGLSTPVGITVVGIMVVVGVAGARRALLGGTLGRAFYARQGKRTTLGSLGRTAMHVFCATDLPTGRPFYFLTWRGGAYTYSPHHGVGQADRIGLRTAVRSSAAFPGAFRPQRLTIDAPAIGSDGTRTSRIVFLADGGVWNNLGTQWYDEHAGRASSCFIGTPPQDGDFIESETGWPPAHQVPRETLRYSEQRPGSRTPDGNPVRRGQLPGTTTDCTLVVDASSPLGRKSLRRLRIPVVAELFGLMRIVRLLYENTVGPRVGQIIQREADAVREDTGRVRYTPAAAFDTDLPQDRVAVVSIDHPVGKKADLTRQYAIHLLTTPTDDGVGELEAPPSTSLLLRARAFLDQLETLDVGGSHHDPREAWGVVTDIPTTLSRVHQESAVAALTHGWLSAMEACHIQFQSPLLPYPGSYRFLKLFERATEHGAGMPARAPASTTGHPRHDNHDLR